MPSPGSTDSPWPRTGVRPGRQARRAAGPGKVGAGRRCVCLCPFHRATRCKAKLFAKLLHGGGVPPRLVSKLSLRCRDCSLAAGFTGREYRESSGGRDDPGYAGAAQHRRSVQVCRGPCERAGLGRRGDGGCGHGGPRRCSCFDDGGVPWLHPTLPAAWALGWAHAAKGRRGKGVRRRYPEHAQILCSFACSARAFVRRCPQVLGAKASAAASELSTSLAVSFGSLRKSVGPPVHFLSLRGHCCASVLKCFWRRR